MAWIKYKYTCAYNQSTGQCHCLWPYIEIELILKNKKQTVLALIDSGCTTTNINAEFAPLFDIDLSKCKRITNTGINSVSEGYLSSLNIKVKDSGEEFESPIIFMDKLPVAVLLGQDNFFEKFDIKFEKRNNSFELRRV